MKAAGIRMSKRSKGHSLFREFRRRCRDDERRLEGGLAQLKQDLGVALKADVPPSEEEQKLLEIDYEVTVEALPDPEIDSLPEKDRAKFEKGFHLVFEKPKRTISIFKELCQKYPHIATFHNNLLVALRSIKTKSEIGEIIYDQYQAFPDYLFARTNYAMWLVRHDRLDEVSSILDGKFKLSALYPERRVFHISEHLNFLGTLAHYFAAIGRISFADAFCALIEEWDDAHSMLESYDNFVADNPIIKIRVLEAMELEVDLSVAGNIEDRQIDSVNEREVFEVNPLLRSPEIEPTES